MDLGDILKSLRKEGGEVELGGVLVGGVNDPGHMTILYHST